MNYLGIRRSNPTTFLDENYSFFLNINAREILSTALTVVTKLIIYFFIISSAELFAQLSYDKNIISDTLVKSKYYPDFNEVNKIEFAGASFFSKDYLLDIITSKRSARSIQHDLFEYYYFNLKDLKVTPKLVDTSFYLAIESLSHEIKFFNQQFAETDLEIIKSGYSANGYHDAEVYYTIVPDFSSDNNILTFNITENRRYLIDTIIFSGLDSIDIFSRLKINELDKIRSGTPFSEAEIYAKINSINSILLNNGYFYNKFEIKPILVNPEFFKDSVTVVFSPGKRQRIKSITFVDSLRNQNEVVMSLKQKLVDLKEGDWFSYLNLQNSLNNLNALGTFEFVSIDTSSAFVPLTDTSLSFVISTKYRKQKEWSIGLFLNNTQVDNYVNLGVEASISHKNWGGAAQMGNIFTNLQAKNISRVLSGEKGEWEGQLGVRMSQPIIWELENMKISASGSFYYSYSTINQLFNISAWYLPLRIPIRLTNETFLNQIILDFNFEFQNPVNYVDVIRLPNSDTITGAPVNNDYYIRFLQSLNLYQTLYYYLNDPGIALLTANIFGITLIGDRRNHPFEPNKGDYFIGSVDGWNFFLSHPWITGIAKYFRVQGAYSIFEKIEDNLTAAFKFKAGFIKLFEPDKAYIPFERQFYAGGANSVRGWSSRELHYSVIEASTDTTLKNGYYLTPVSYSLLSNIVGNAGLLEGSIELRYKLPRPRGVDEMISEQISKFGFVAFVDFGNAYNWLAENDFARTSIKWYEYISKVAWAVGFGIRYDTPIGPLRADFGFPVYRPNYNLPDYKIWTTQNVLGDIRIHFGIGHSF